jgi:hypothetical protein
MTSTETDTRIVTIDYRQTLGEMIAAGDYDSVNGHITEVTFPLPTGRSGADPRSPGPRRLDQRCLTRAR